MMLRFRALALLILFSVSTIGNAFDVHYCEGQVTDISLYGDTDCCCVAIEVETASCHSEVEDKCHFQEKEESSDKKMTKKDCCETASFELIGDTDFAISKSVSIPLAIICVHFNTFFFQDLSEDLENDFYYQPPYRVKDLPIFNQSFLI